MSTWYVNAEWSDFHAVDGGPVIEIAVDGSFVDPGVSAGDALSAPTVSDLLPSGMALWPRGAAWGTPDGEAPSLTSVFAKLTSAILAPFAELYARAWRLTEEARSASLVDSLEEWEADFGLPDPCVTSDQDEEARLVSLRGRVARLATITPADMIALAARLGYVVAIEEPDGFLAGVSACGGLGELSDAPIEQQWVVMVRSAPIEQFEAGIGETGVTPLLDFGHDILECAIRRISPAWTQVVFNYAPVPVAPLLVTETGAIIVTENRARLVAPILPGE